MISKKRYIVFVLNLFIGIQYVFADVNDGLMAYSKKTTQKLLMSLKSHQVKGILQRRII